MGYSKPKEAKQQRDLRSNGTLLAVFAGSWLVVAWSVNALSRPLAIKECAQLVKPLRGRIVQGWDGKPSTSAQQLDGSAFSFPGVMVGGEGAPVGKEHTHRACVRTLLRELPPAA